jgi:hypothetical protein
MLKKGDVIDDADDDDELRTSASQNHVTATLFTDELFLRTQYIYVYRVGCSIVNYFLWARCRHHWWVVSGKMNKIR